MLALHIILRITQKKVDNEPVTDTVSKIDEEYHYSMQYDENSEMIMLPDVMKLYGFDENSVNTINLRLCKDDNGQFYNDNHYIQFDIGKKDITYCKPEDNISSQTNLVGIFVRGTHGTAEWYSNFDIGNTDEWQEGTDWRTKENHMGFDIAAVRAKKRNR